jgi:hypothetical protein
MIPLPSCIFNRAEVLKLEGTEKPGDTLTVGVEDNFLNRLPCPDLILKEREEDGLKVHLFDYVVAVRVRVIPDECPPKAVSSEPKVGLELALAQPVSNLSDTVFTAIEVLVDGFGFDKETSRISIVVT